MYPNTKVRSKNTMKAQIPDAINALGEWASWKTEISWYRVHMICHLHVLFETPDAVFHLHVRKSSVLTVWTKFIKWRCGRHKGSGNVLTAETDVLIFDVFASHVSTFFDLASTTNRHCPRHKRVLWSVRRLFWSAKVWLWDFAVFVWGSNLLVRTVL